LLRQFISIKVSGKIQEREIIGAEISDTVLFDRDSRTEFGPVVSEMAKNGSVTTEIGSRGANRSVDVVGLYKMGTSFGSDGNIITSHLNFLRIFNTSRRIGFINVGLIKLKPETDVEVFKNKLKAYLPKDVKVLSKQELMDFEKHYWESSTAIGFVFNLGVMLGIMVGVVVVYQILYSNVSEHLSEYATLKAIGYRHQYLLSLVLQQAFLIAILGYIPGFLIASIQYEVTKQATLLPITMTFNRALLVLVATVTMCFISGASAVQKLKAADPADIF
jgi:putative ABC transport system permease protein